MKTLQSITAETAQNGTAIVNPAVVGLGWVARYTIDVQPENFPDRNIVWSIAQGAGNIVFQSGNTDRSVVMRGNAVGDFKLEATIGDPSAPLVTYACGIGSDL